MKPNLFKQVHWEQPQRRSDIVQHVRNHLGPARNVHNSAWDTPGVENGIDSLTSIETVRYLYYNTSSLEQNPKQASLEYLFP